MKQFLNIALVIIIAVTSLFCTSCSISIDKKSSDKKIEKTFTASEFKGISAQSNVKIEYTISDTVTIKAKGAEDKINNLCIVVGKDSILHITDKEEKDINPRHIVLNFHDDDEECTIYITGPSISTLDICGSAEFDCKDPLANDNLSIRISGSADIDIDSVAVNTFDAQTSGAGAINIKALKAETASFSTSGAGDIDTKLIDVKKTTIEVNGAGDIDAEFQNCDVADIRISGAGDLKLSGNLKHLNKQISGAADIDDKNLKVKQ